MGKNKQGVIFSGQSTRKEKDQVNQEISKLDKLVDRSQNILYRIKAVFPFNFFTDEIIIDASKVNVIRRIFVKTGNVRSVTYEDIFEVSVNYSLFFATLEVADRFFQEAPIIINYLKKSEALKARRIIQGMLIALKEKVQIDQIENKILINKLEELGKAREAGAF